MAFFPLSPIMHDHAAVIMPKDCHFISFFISSCETKEVNIKEGRHNLICSRRHFFIDWFKYKLKGTYNRKLVIPLPRPLLTLPCLWALPSFQGVAWQTPISSSTPNSISPASLKASLDSQAEVSQNKTELLLPCCPCNNLFIHELPCMIPHLFLLSSTMTGVYWQSINTCLQMICFRTVWLEMYPAIQGSEYIKAFCLFRLLQEQKGTKQNGKS